MPPSARQGEEMRRRSDLDRHRQYRYYRRRGLSAVGLAVPVGLRET
jgi:hypothetical protein